MKNGKIKHIFFDIGGVLLNIEPMQSIQYWSDCTDLPVHLIENNFPHKAHEQYEIGKLTDHEFFRAVKDALPQPNCLKEEDFWRGWNRLIIGETETVSLLSPLKRIANVYLLSNTNPQHIHYEVTNRFHFQHEVSCAFYSFDLGYRKPQAEMFSTVLQFANAAPSESLLIDDTLVNVEKSREIGYTAIHYKSHKETVYELKNLGLLSNVYDKEKQ